MNDKKTYLLSYDHGGFILWGPQFLSTLETAEKWLRQYPKFKIGLDNETYAYDKYAEDNPEIIDGIKEMMEKYGDRFDIGSSSYGQPLACFINEESNVRQITYAIETNLRHFGVRPDIYVISEHAFHSQIPQLIKKAGYEMTIMRTHFQMYGYNPSYRSAFGSWRGEDGTEIDCIPTYEGQGAHFGLATMDNYVLTRWPDWECSIDDFIEKFKEIDPLLATRYDDAVLRREEFTALAEARDDLEWVTLRDLKEIYRSAEKDLYCPSADEFATRMPWGYCGNRMFNRVRQAESEIILAERLSAFCLLRGKTFDEEGLSSAWKDLLISQHHDIQICGLQALFDGYMKHFTNTTEKLRGSAISALSRDFACTDGTEILVMNCSDKEVSQMICQTVTGCKFKEGSHLSVLFRDEEIPCEYIVLDSKKGTVKRANVRFTATLPPFTARKFRLMEEENTEGENEVCPTFTARKFRLMEEENVAGEEEICPTEINTEYYRILLGKGGIKKIIDRASGKVLSEASGEGRLFSGIIDGRNCESEGVWSVKENRLSIKARYSGNVGSIPCRFTMELRTGDPYIYCDLSMDYDGEKIGSTGKFKRFMDNTNGFIHEDKLRFVICADFKEDAAGYRDRPFLVTETAQSYIEGNYWTGISDREKSLVVLNRGTMCLVREKDCCSVPLAYANSYEWGERYLYGTYRYEFAFCLSSEGFDLTKTHTDALKYTYPLVSCQLTEKRAGEDELTYLPLRSDENILLSALYPDKGRCVLRFYEIEGRDGTVNLGALKAEKVNLLLEKTEDAEDNVLTVAPHEVSTIVI